MGIVKAVKQTTPANGNEAMKVTTEQLNLVATLLDTEDKSAVLSVVIGTLVKEGGMSVREAVDAVFGEGGYDKLASEVYASLKAA